MKHTKILWALFVLIIGLAMPLSVNAQSEALPSRETVQMVKTELSKLQQILPIEGGVGMIITAIEYDDATNTIKYRYQYTIPGATKPSDAQLREGKELVITVAKSDQRQKQLLEQGISFRYDYYSIDDEFLYSVTLAPDDMFQRM